MLGISYTRADDPGVVGTQWGGGADGRMLFSADCRDAFDRSWWPDSAPQSLVDHNAEFADGPVDHFGLTTADPDGFFPVGQPVVDGPGHGEQVLAGQGPRWREVFEADEARVMGHGWLAGRLAVGDAAQDHGAARL